MATRVSLFQKVNDSVKEIEGWIREYDRFGAGKVEVQRVIVQSNSEEEKSARQAGIVQTQSLDDSEFYFGLAVRCGDQSKALPVIAGINKSHFEYYLTKVISQVQSSGRKTLGLMTGLPLRGNKATRQPASILYEELKKNYDIHHIDQTTDAIEYTDDSGSKMSPDLLVVVHPAGITEGAQFAIDQFVLSGKNAVMFLDPFSMEAANSRPPVFQKRSPANGIPPSSNVETLLSGWGLTFSGTQVIADKGLKARESGNNPIALNLNKRHIERGDVVTSEIDSLLFVLAGGFSVDNLAEGLKLTRFAETSELNQWVNPREALENGESILNDFRSSGHRKILALRISGVFKTAVPNGPPNRRKPSTPQLKESTKPAAVYLFGDCDFLSRQFAMSRGISPTLANHNLPLALNAIEQAALDNALLEIELKLPASPPASEPSR